MMIFGCRRVRIRDGNVHWETEGHLKLAARGTTSGGEGTVSWGSYEEIGVGNCITASAWERRKEDNIRDLCHYFGRSLGFCVRVLSDGKVRRCRFSRGAVSITKSD